MCEYTTLMTKYGCPDSSGPWKTGYIDLDMSLDVMKWSDDNHMFGLKGLQQLKLTFCTSNLYETPGANIDRHFCLMKSGTSCPQGKNSFKIVCNKTL